MVKKAFRYRGEPVSLRALLVSVFVSMGGFIFGYDIGYISGCLAMRPFINGYGTLSPNPTYPGELYLSPARQAIITAILSAGSFTGALLGTPTADFLGRRGAIFTAAMVFLAGVIVQVAPTEVYGAFLAGRYLAGAGVGALSALVPLYQGEISPKSLRGGFTSLYQLMITLGILLAYCVDYGTKDRNDTGAYRIPIAIQCLWALILAAGCPFIPKSPRESVYKGKHDDARRTISQMHGVDIKHPLVEYHIKEIEAKIKEENAAGSGYLQCFNFKSDFKTGQRTLVGMGVQSFQQLTGANFIFYYGTVVFNDVSSLDSYVSQIIFGLLDFLGTIPGLYCLDRFGRRRTMITGAIVMGLSYMLYGVLGAYALYPNNDPNLPARSGTGGAIIFVICVFVLAYGCSWGPGGWVNTGEIAPLRTKAKQLSFIAASNWTWNFLLSYFSPYIASDIGAKYGFVFFGANFLAAAFIYFFVPEMSGLSLEEINMLWQEGVSPRKSIAWNREVRSRDHRIGDDDTVPGSTVLEPSGEVSPKEKAKANGAQASHFETQREPRTSESTAV